MGGIRRDWRSERKRRRRRLLDSRSSICRFGNLALRCRFGAEGVPGVGDSLVDRRCNSFLGGEKELVFFGEEERCGINIHWEHELVGRRPQ